MSPSSTTPSDRDRQAIAARLQEATGNALDINFAGKDCFISSDESSAGHLYYALMPVENDENAMFLDDRSPDSLDIQLVKELRRMAKFYEDLAGKTEKNLAANQA